MIKGIGIDTIEIERFSEWHNHTQKALETIFTKAEITYCLAVSAKSAERFAVRFAAKEAFFKAFCASYPEMSPDLKNRPFNAIEVQHAPSGAPLLSIDWKSLLTDSPFHEKPALFVSLSHSKTMATAVVLIQEQT